MVTNERMTMSENKELPFCVSDLNASSSNEAKMNDVVIELG